MTSFSRTTFNTSRSMEFFDEKKLQMQLGYSKRDWPTVLLKELIDNSLDACENAGAQPEIGIILEPDSFSVFDNGPGIPATTIEGSLDYSTRTSDKSFYISPTRGQLGNALKCLWAAPFVANGEAGQVEVSAHGTIHYIDVQLDRIAQTPEINHRTEPSLVKTGTFIKIHWPGIASYQRGSISTSFYKLVEHFSLLNPHAILVLKLPEGEPSVFKPSIPNWDKWTTKKPISPHWYSVSQLRSLIAAYLTDSQKTQRQKPIREFVAEFDGLSGTAKQKSILDELQLTGAYLNELIKNNDVDLEKVAQLLDAMEKKSRPIPPKKLGVITEEHFSQSLRTFCDSIRYKKAEVITEGLPYLIEVAFGVQKDEGQSNIKIGLNWSPTLKNPIHEVTEILDNCRIDEYDPIVLFIHIACPSFDFTETGKGALVLPEEVLAKLKNAVNAVTAKWRKEKRYSDRDNRINQQKLDELRKAYSFKPISLKEAAYLSMEEAYLKASANGRLPANARQIMYAARPLVLELTGGRCWDNSSYFTQRLLPDYIERCSDLTTNWDVVFDARGRLIEPHTQDRTDLGTLEVRRYIQNWQPIISDEVTMPIDYMCKTSGPSHRYNYALFIEKEGFYPLLERSNIANIYDIAIMSTKGMPVVAARSLVEEMWNLGVTLLVLHDFDKSGFSILNSFRSNNRRYTFSTKPKVIDVGLRLKDVEELGLISEFVEYDGSVNPKINLRESGATPEECEFLVRANRGGKWIGERVELNAMPSDVFINWLQSKLEALGVNKVIPDEKTLEVAYRRAYQMAIVEESINETIASFDDTNIEIPNGLTDLIAKSVNGTDTSWDEAIGDLAKQNQQKAEP